MADDIKLSVLTELAEAPDNSDLIFVQDVSDTSMTPAGTVKELTVAETGVAQYSDTAANFTGVLQHNGNNVLVESGIGIVSQAYDVNTVKYNDVTANFTGVLQHNGNDVLTTANIDQVGGVQSYDANTAKYNIASDFTGVLQQGGVVVLDEGDVDISVQAYDANLAGCVSAFTLPTTDGSADQVVKTNGSGVIGFKNKPEGLQLTASGAVTDGAPVVINADGTVSAVASSAASIGTPVQFESGVTVLPNSGYDPVNEKVLTIYCDDSNSDRFTGVVGTITGNTISYGTPVVIDTDNGIFTKRASGISYDPTSGNFLIVYIDGSGNGVGVVVTISGDTFTLGTAVTFSAVNTWATAISYDEAADKHVVTFAELSDYYLDGIVATVSGTSVSFGTPTVIHSGDSFASLNKNSPVCYDPIAQKHLSMYTDDVSSDRGRCKVLTVSGTSLSVGSEYTFRSASVNNVKLAITYDNASGKMLLAYQGGGGSARTATISGTSVSFGTEASFAASGSTPSIGLAHHSVTGDNFIAYANQNESSYSGQIAEVIVSGTSLSFGTRSTFETGESEYIDMIDTPQGLMITYIDSGDGERGKGVVWPVVSTNLESNNFIGFAADTVANAQPVAVQTKFNIDDAQSGLTPGQRYYVGTDGSLGLVAGVPEVDAGIAIAANKIIVKG